MPNRSDRSSSVWYCLKYLPSHTFDSVKPRSDWGIQVILVKQQINVTLEEAKFDEKNEDLFLKGDFERHTHSHIEWVWIKTLKDFSVFYLFKVNDIKRFLWWRKDQRVIFFNEIIFNRKLKIQVTSNTLCMKNTSSIKYSLYFIPTHVYKLTRTKRIIPVIV